MLLLVLFVDENVCGVDKGCKQVLVFIFLSVIQLHKAD